MDELFILSPLLIITLGKYGWSSFGIRMKLTPNSRSGSHGGNSNREEGHVFKV